MTNIRAGLGLVTLVKGLVIYITCLASCQRLLSIVSMVNLGGSFHTPPITNKMLHKLAQNFSFHIAGTDELFVLLKTHQELVFLCELELDASEIVSLAKCATTLKILCNILASLW